MVHELNNPGIPVQLVPMDELSQVLNQTPSGTVVTHRYFIKDAEAIAAPKSVRVIPVDIYDFAQNPDAQTITPRQLCWHCQP